MSDTFGEHCATCCKSDTCKSKDCVKTIDKFIQIDKDRITELEAQLAEKELQVDKLAGWYSESQGQITGLKRVVERIKLMAMGWHNQENYIAVTELIEQELAKAKEGS